MSLMDKHNYDPEIAAYGFGACLPGSEVASDCFPLNGNTDNPYIGGLEVFTLFTYIPLVANKILTFESILQV